MNNKKIKVLWQDARVFSPQDKNIALSKMETIGFIERENEHHLVLNHPFTINVETKAAHPLGKKPTFYIIPKKVIISVKELS